MQNCKIKKHYKVKYTQIDNMLINDMQLSFQAKGLFLYIWSKPDDWQVNVKAMQHNCIDKQTKIYSALKELEDRGYLIRKRYYENGKVAGINYHFSDIKEYDFDQELLNQENLNEVNLNEEILNEYIYIQKKDITKERLIQKKYTASGFSQNENSVVNDSFTTQNPTVKESLQVQKPNKEIDFPQEFIEFYEGYEGKHPSKQKARASKVLSKWRNACKTRTNAEILLAVEFYAKYIELTKQTWKNGIGQQKKRLEFWLTSDYELDWEEKYNEEQNKQQKPTFNNQYAKPKLSTTSQVAEMFRTQARYIENNKETNNDEDEYPF